jgi:hypothetical protein
MTKYGTFKYALTQTSEPDGSCFVRADKGRAVCFRHGCVHIEGAAIDHRGPKHTLVKVRFQHILYVGYVCMTCKVFLIDEEQ